MHMLYLLKFFLLQIAMYLLSSINDGLSSLGKQAVIVSISFKCLYLLEEVTKTQKGSSLHIRYESNQ